MAARNNNKTSLQNEYWKNVQSEHYLPWKNVNYSKKTPWKSVILWQFMLVFQIIIITLQRKSKSN